MMDKFKKEYDELGVTVIKKLFSKQEIKNLKKKINNYIKKKKNKLKGKEINFIKNKINSIHHFKDNYFKKFSKLPKIIKLGEILLNDKIKFRKCEYFAKPQKMGLESPMHQDNYYWNLSKGLGLTIWVAIDKSLKNNGNVKYLLKSHKGGLVKHIASYAPGSSQKVDNIKKYNKKYELKRFNLDIGDCVVRHSQVIHGSEKNKSNKSRRAFTIQLTAKSEKINKDGLKKYNLSLKKQIALRRNMSIS